MAIKAAVRFKPDVYRSSLEATIMDLDTSVSPPRGTVVMTAQLVTYDDTEFTGPTGNNPYRAGHPDSERHITVLYEEAIFKALEVFGPMSQAQALAEWTTALQAFGARMTTAGPTLVKAIRAARMAAPQILG